MIPRIWPTGCRIWRSLARCSSRAIRTGWRGISSSSTPSGRSRSRARRSHRRPMSFFGPARWRPGSRPQRRRGLRGSWAEGRRWRLSGRHSRARNPALGRSSGSSVRQVSGSPGSCSNCGECSQRATTPSSKADASTTAGRCLICPFSTF